MWEGGKANSRCVEDGVHFWSQGMSRMNKIRTGSKIWMWVVVHIGINLHERRSGAAGHTTGGVHTMDVKSNALRGKYSTYMSDSWRLKFDHPHTSTSEINSGSREAPLYHKDEQRDIDIP
jgi:hypothetical protein